MDNHHQNNKHLREFKQGLYQCAYAIDSIPPLLVMLCAVIVDALVYIPLSILGDLWGVRIYESDMQELKEDHEKRKNGR